MKLLLDENIPHELRHDLIGHDVFTVTFMKWNGLKNGKLLAAAGAEGFNALLTLDRGIPYQADHATLPVAVVVIAAGSDRISDLRDLVPVILTTLSTLPPCTVAKVSRSSF